MKKNHSEQKTREQSANVSRIVYLGTGKSIIER